MTENDVGSAAGAAAEDELAVDGNGDRGGRWIPVAIAAAAIGAVVGAPWALGFGPAGARIFTSHEIPVHILNLSGQDVDIELAFTSPKRVTAGTLETLETLSGGATLVTRSPDGAVVEELEIEADGPVFYNVGGGTCFAVFDLSEFYGDDERGGDLRVVARLDESTRLYAFDAETVVLPRGVAPAAARGKVQWIEPVGCNLLELDEEPALIAQNLMRLRERRERRDEELRRVREAANQE
ncbi:MAG: hypothetical protein H6698_05925 [Myxococcales bacterium]|nr:hypothetical protein [Myxococcales bacterium]MCB9533843.1 hypothetical protein [Myxococcales bacterium]